MGKEKSKGVLPTLEIIIILFFFIAFLVWMVPKCKSGPDPLPQPEQLTDSLAQETATDTAAIEGPVNPTPPPPPPQTRTEVVSRLYITIDGLKMRKAPELNSEVIVQLPLFEEVYFLNEVTDSTQEISLGYEVANEPWVKVRTKKGHEGWVYGAGVNYYKKRRAGVLE
jgi:hypothetical protein